MLDKSEQIVVHDTDGRDAVDDRRRPILVRLPSPVVTS